MEKFVDYCKTWIAEHIEGYVGQHFYGGDFGYTLTEGPNVDGSCTYSRPKAIEYLKEWWSEVADYSEYYELSYGGPSPNLFEDPEKYMVLMLIDGCNLLLSNTRFMEENWDEEFELTEEAIQSILEDVNKQTAILFV